MKAVSLAVCESQRGKKNRCVRLGQWLWLHKKAEQELPGLEKRGYKVFGNDFTDVDFREELCHHSLTEYGKISGGGTGHVPGL